MLNFSNITNNSEILIHTIEWKFFIFPVANGHFNPATDLKFVIYPLLNIYFFYFMVKLVVKYKAQLEPVHIFELNAFGDMLGAPITKMINYDPYLCVSKFYNCELIHLINYLFKQSLSLDMAIGKDNQKKDWNYNVVRNTGCACANL